MIKDRLHSSVRDQRPLLIMECTWNNIDKLATLIIMVIILSLGVMQSHLKNLFYNTFKRMFLFLRVCEYNNNYILIYVQAHFFLQIILCVLLLYTKILIIAQYNYYNIIIMYCV